MILRIVFFYLLILNYTYPQQKDSKVDFKDWTLEEKAAYIIGLQIGEDLKKQKLTPDLDKLLLGLKDASKDHGLTEKEISSILKAYRQKVSDVALKKEQEYFKNNLKNPGIKSTKSGVQYKVLKSTTGIIPEKTDFIRCLYKSYLPDGTVLDAPKDPVVFAFTDALTGWQHALSIMPEGSKWRLFIPSKLAFGELGLPPKVPPYNPLIIELELLSVINKKRADESEKKFFDENAKKEGVIKRDDGIQYKILKKGHGRSPKKGNAITCRYKGLFLDQSVFDNTIGESSLIEFDKMIKGWQNIITEMREGDKWQIAIPYKLAYGDKGMLPYIPPYATLIYEVELLRVKR